MNDEFMFISRPRVRAAFSKELYHRLNQQEKGSLMEKSMNGRNQLNWKLVLAAFLITFAGIFTFSPKVRVVAGELIDEIAGFFVKEETENPLAEHLDEDGVLDLPPNATVVFITPVAVDSILEDPPFEFSLPTYIPEGFENKKDKVAQALSGTWISVNYIKFHVGEITFMAELATPDLSIGVGSAEEITINDETAMLIRGSWSRDGSHTWDYDSGFTICWTVNGINYRLIFYRSAGYNADELLPELIKMAESVH